MVRFASNLEVRSCDCTKTKRRARLFGVPRRGFSFTEILFAVMILGIGFIMVAAMFPVAIRQTQWTVEQTTGASMARSAVTDIGQMNGSVTFPANTLSLLNPYTTTSFPLTAGRTVAYDGTAIGIFAQAPGPFWPAAPFPAPFANPIPGSLPPALLPGSLPVLTNPLPSAVPTYSASFWTNLSGNLILPTDSRYAWVPVYNRGYTNALQTTVAPMAQLTVFSLRCRNPSTFTPSADLIWGKVSTPAMPPNLHAKLLLARFMYGGSGPDIIQFLPDSGGIGTPQFQKIYFDPTSSSYTWGPDLTQNSGQFGTPIGPGAYVVVADDSQTPLSSMTPAQTINGYVYRVGNLSTTQGAIGSDFWELQPGNDMKNALYTAYGAASVIGTPPLLAASMTVRVFVVGKGYNDPIHGDFSFTGPVMDVSCFSSFLNVH
jgi:hypothetical protein